MTILASLVGVCLVLPALPTKSSNELLAIIQSAPTVERVEALGDLCVLRIRSSDMLEATSPDYRASRLIMGGALTRIDLRQVSLDSDAQAKTLQLQTPPLQVIQPRVDHERTRWWDTGSDCWHNGWLTFDKTGKTACVS